MSRKPTRAERPAQAHPAPRRDQQRRARTEIEFDGPAVLGVLFGQFDANLVHIENRLGVYISARGNRVQIEGPEDAVARAREVLRSMHERLEQGQDIDSGAVEALITMSAEPTLEGIITGDNAPPLAPRNSGSLRATDQGVCATYASIAVRT